MNTLEKFLRKKNLLEAFEEKLSKRVRSRDDYFKQYENHADAIANAFPWYPFEFWSPINKKWKKYLKRRSILIKAKSFILNLFK